MKPAHLACTLLFAASLALSAGEAPTPSLAEVTLKKFEPVKLTEEQSAEIRELAAKAEPKLNELRDAVGLSDEQRAAQKEATFRAKAAGKKGKEMGEAVQEAMDLTPQQKSAQRAFQEATLEFHKAAMDVLTSGQKKVLAAAAKKSQKKT